MAKQGFLWAALTFATSLVAGLISLGVAPAEAASRDNGAEFAPRSKNNPYAGLWVTADGQVRHEILPEGRYIDAQGDQERAYEGRYLLIGNHIEYRDDTGFTVSGDFQEGILYRADMVLYRRDS